jgi:hypothetical protein
LAGVKGHSLDLQPTFVANGARTQRHQLARSSRNSDAGKATTSAAERAELAAICDLIAETYGRRT